MADWHQKCADLLRENKTLKNERYELQLQLAEARHAHAQSLQRVPDITPPTSTREERLEELHVELQEVKRIVQGLGQQQSEAPVIEKVVR